MNKKTSPSLDARPDRLDLRDREYRPPLKNLPATFPSVKNVEQLFKHYAVTCNLILDQGEEGACTGFGLAAVINYLNWKDHYLEAIKQGISLDETANDYCVLPVSERMLYHNARLYDEWEGEDYEGSSCRGALKGWHRHGVCDAKLWPYRDSKGNVKFIEPRPGWSKNAIETPLGSYYRINIDSVVDMQSAIFEVGAIYCSAGVHDGWNEPQASATKDRTDPFNYLPSVSDVVQEENGGHAFAIVGYTRDGFIVQNSWNTGWGFHGFAIMSYQDWVTHGWDAWVVVRGAPINQEKSPVTVVHQPLLAEQAQSDDRAGQTIDRMRDTYIYTDDRVKPWSEEQGYQHTLVIGNNGRAIQKLIEFQSPEDTIKELGSTLPQKWIDDSGGKDIVIYAHGGLNSEKKAVRRAQVLGPYFMANGIYPIFICWKTGLWETLDNILSDFFSGLQDDSRAGGMLEDLRSNLREKFDRTLEVAAKNAGGKSIWSEMKENARLACEHQLPGTSGNAARTKGAMLNLAHELGKLDGVNLHLMGHSAGAILLGHWLHAIRNRNLSFKSLSLFAPACSTRFANNYYRPVIEKGRLKNSTINIDVLSNERELADSVGPYGKSLLYLISRALEDMHKEPLLGLEAAWQQDDSFAAFMDKNRVEITEEEKVRMKEISDWLDFWGDHNLPTVHDNTRSNIDTSIQGDQIALAHGSFDNDILVINKALCRILGVNNLEVKIENLGGF